MIRAEKITDGAERGMWLAYDDLDGAGRRPLAVRRLRRQALHAARLLVEVEAAKAQAKGPFSFDLHDETRAVARALGRDGSTATYATLELARAAAELQSALTGRVTPIRDAAGTVVAMVPGNAVRPGLPRKR